MDVASRLIQSIVSLHASDQPLHQVWSSPAHPSATSLGRPSDEASLMWLVYLQCLIELLQYVIYHTTCYICTFVPDLYPDGRGRCRAQGVIYVGIGHCESSQQRAITQFVLRQAG